MKAKCNCLCIPLRTSSHKWKPGEIVSARITSDHLAKRTKRQLVGSTFASLFLVLMSTSVLTTDQLSSVWIVVIPTAFIAGLIAILRNRIMQWVFPRIAFSLHYRLRRNLLYPFVAISFSVFYPLMIRFPEEHRAVYGPILSAIFTAYGLLWALGGALTSKGESSLMFAQSVFELYWRGDSNSASRWFNRGLRPLAEILKRRGMELDLPTLRLGARLCCFEERTNPGIVGTISRAILNLENPKHFQELREAIATLNAEGKDGIAKGISPPLEFLDYFDIKYLTLKNIGIVATIVMAVIAVVSYLTRGAGTAR